MLWPGLVCVIMDLLGGWQMIQFKDMLDLISHHNIHFKHAQEYCLNWICRFSRGKGKSLFFLAKQFLDQRQGRTWQNLLSIWLQKVNHVHMHGTDYQRRSMQKRSSEICLGVRGPVEVEVWGKNVYPCGIFWQDDRLTV